MRPYPAYKASGVDWLGEVPEGWEVVPLKLPFTIIGGTTPKTGIQDYWDGNIPWVTPADLSNLPGRQISSTARQITEMGLASCGTTMAQAGSIILSTRAPIGSLAVSTVEMCTNQGCKALEPSQETSVAFFYYVLNAAKEALNVLGRGSTFLELSGDQLGAFRIPLPPLPEQREIAAFLDREVGKIDALVEESRQLIALLAEKRQATISHAVTRGLNPAARLRPSGIDWLGDIPEGWDVVRLKRIINGIESGTSVNASDTPAGEGELGVLKTSCVYSGTFDPMENKTVIPEDIGRVSCPLKVGTMIVSRMNTPDLVGAAGFVEEAPPDIFLPDRLWQVSFVDAEPAFVHFWTQTPFYRNQVKSACAGTSASMQNLSQDDFRGFQLALPPAPEQVAIIQSLKVALPNLDALTAEANSAISLLLERRAALISAAVTGKIDVRGAAPAPAQERT